MRFNLIFSALALSLAGSALAATYTESVPVLDARPVYERVVKRDCTDTPITRTEKGSGTAGALVGGLAGGLLGHTVGAGSGKTAATIVGAVGGAVVGSAVDQGRNVETQVGVSQTCRESTQDVLQGYDVTYDWHGQRMTTHTAGAPGPTIPVVVNVEPAVR